MPSLQGGYTIDPNARMGGRNTAVEADARNYDLGNDPNGLEKAKTYLDQQNSNAQNVAAPDIINSPLGQQAQGYGAVADQSRRNQNALAWELQRQASGEGYSPAIAQLQSTTATAQGQQRSIAHGATGYDLAAANREAAWGNSALTGQQAQQTNILRAQQMASARDQYGALAGQMRGQDLANASALQQQAIQQAGLTDARRTQADQQAQWTYGEQDRLRRAQTGANMNFEQQDAANKLGQGNQNASAAEFNQQMANKYNGMLLSFGGSLMSAGGAMARQDQAETNGSGISQKDRGGNY